MLKKGFLFIFAAICFFVAGVVLILREENSLFVIGMSLVALGIAYSALSARWFKKNNKKN
jgi:multisubunit Na+/H+ antiporter MnhC subunit